MDHVDSVCQRWFYCKSPRPRAQLRLFCFPQAGGGTVPYFSWPDRVSKEIEVLAAQLPGRERRQNEPLMINLDQIVAGLAVAIEPRLDRPFAFFGHSFGALIAFELARSLRREALRTPFHLFLAARRAPQLPMQDNLIHQLPRDQFLRDLQDRYGPLPDVVHQNPELVEFFLPVIRADISAVETYRYSHESPLECALTVYGGEADHSTTMSELAAWRAQTTGEFTMRILSGAHFFPQTSRDLLLEDISSRLRQRVDEGS